ncbi:hypothetical protein FACS189449_12420 [Alphaproteobacteria bacterium]|nr:hypothetical protein FACS189449_12420 [Alphaproteobacteria bacterium]
MMLMSAVSFDVYSMQFGTRSTGGLGLDIKVFPPSEKVKKFDAMHDGGPVHSSNKTVNDVMAAFNRLQRSNEEELGNLGAMFSGQLYSDNKKVNDFIVEHMRVYELFERKYVRAYADIESSLVQDAKNAGLYDAVHRGSIEDVRSFVEEGANPNAIDKNKKTPLQYASPGSDIAEFLESRMASGK